MLNGFSVWDSKFTVNNRVAMKEQFHASTGWIINSSAPRPLPFKGDLVACKRLSLSFLVHRIGHWSKNFTTNNHFKVRWSFGKKSGAAGTDTGCKINIGCSQISRLKGSHLSFDAKRGKCSSV